MPKVALAKQSMQNNAGFLYYPHFCFSLISFLTPSKIITWIVDQKMKKLSFTPIELNIIKKKITFHTIATYSFVQMLF